MDELLLKEIRATFPIGSEWKIAEIKEKLKEIYNKISIKEDPKVSVLCDYFNLRITKDEKTGKRIVHIEKEEEE